MTDKPAAVPYIARQNSTTSASFAAVKYQASCREGHWEGNVPHASALSDDHGQGIRFSSELRRRCKQQRLKTLPFRQYHVMSDMRQHRTCTIFAFPSVRTAVSNHTAPSTFEVEEPQCHHSGRSTVRGNEIMATSSFSTNNLNPSPAPNRPAATHIVII